MPELLERRTVGRGLGEERMGVNLVGVPGKSQGDIESGEAPIQIVTGRHERPPKTESQRDPQNPHNQI